jgi:hypothetical protein
MRRRQFLFARRTRSALAWSLLSFIALQLGLSYLMSRPLPELRDPEYGYKFKALRQRLQASAGQPLFLLLGSSRTDVDLIPEVMAAADTGAPQQPLLFNFSMTGCGPIQELIALRRLLAAGIRPDGVIIEVLPPLLHQAEGWGEVKWLRVPRLGWEEVGLVKRYTVDAFPLADWLQSTLLPCYGHRFAIMSYVAPGWLSYENRLDGWTSINQSGWVPFTRDPVTPQRRQKALKAARRNYELSLAQFHVTANADHAVRDLLRLCRRNDIRAMLVLLPEGTTFQSWYPEGARQEIDDYLRRLSAELSVPLVDMRSWMPESDFIDSHHLLPGPAAEFSARFGREVLPSFRQGVKASRDSDPQKLPDPSKRYEPITLDYRIPVPNAKPWIVGKPAGDF